MIKAKNRLPSRLERALKTLKEETRLPAGSLTVEVDGRPSKSFDLSQDKGFEIAFSPTAESIVLRDERGHPRAFVLLAFDRPDRLEYDGGWLRLSIAKVGQKQLLRVEQTEAALTARGEHGHNVTPLPRWRPANLDKTDWHLQPVLDYHGRERQLAFSRRPLSWIEVQKMGVTFKDVLALHDRNWKAPNAVTLAKMLSLDRLLVAFDCHSRRLIAILHTRQCKAGDPIGFEAMIHGIKPGQSACPVECLKDDAIVAHALIVDQGIKTQASSWPNYRGRGRVAQKLVQDMLLPWARENLPGHLWCTSSPMPGFVDVGCRLVYAPDFKILLDLTRKHIAEHALPHPEIWTLEHICESALAWLRNHTDLAIDKMLELGSKELGRSPNELPVGFFAFYKALASFEEMPRDNPSTGLLSALQSRKPQGGQELLDWKAAMAMLTMAATFTQAGVYDTRTGQLAEPVQRLHANWGAELEAIVWGSRPYDTRAVGFGQQMLYKLDWEELAEKEDERCRQRATGKEGLAVDIELADAAIKRSTESYVPWCLTA